MKRKIYIIGAGFSSLSAACYLAKDGHDVTIFEKNTAVGGRARQLLKDGFTFDIGPTWYWMPDVFERFFADLGVEVSDYYELEKLVPAYKVYFGPDDDVIISDKISKIISTFEQIEPGAGEKLRDFLAVAKSNYDIAIKELVYRPGISPFELVTKDTIQNLGQFFGTISEEVRTLFSDLRLIRILEFPVLFLGAKPSKTPSFYSFMNYADFGLGTWYPKGGMYSVVQGIQRLANELGVKIETNSSVDKILTNGRKAVGLKINGEDLFADTIISGADYHHSETLLDENLRSYKESFWESKTFAPSSLLFYVGFDRKIENVEHHTLFFDADFDQHAKDIYDSPRWPDEPLFYASFPSKTDSAAAPEGKEAGIFLIPLAPGLPDDESTRESYFWKIIDRMEKLTKQNLRKSVLFKESFCVKDFISEYNSYKGNAYGLANTLFQTAFLRPKLKSRKVENLYFTGQLTVPGPGVPPALISGKLVAGLITKNKDHEITVR